MKAAATSELLSAYCRTHYQVLIESEVIVLRIDQYETAADRRLCSGCDIRHGWSIVTPCNPYSQPLSEVDNARRLQALHLELRGLSLRWMPSLNRGPAGEWPDEPGVLLCDPPAGVAERLGRNYRQNAIVSGEPGAAPHLVWL